MVTLKQSLQEEIPFKKFGRVYTSKEKKKKRKKFDSDVYTRPNEQGDIVENRNQDRVQRSVRRRFSVWKRCDSHRGHDKS